MLCVRLCTVVGGCESVVKGYGRVYEVIEEMDKDVKVM